MSILDPEPREDPTLVHICEVCGKTETKLASEAFDEGWDYPPRMGEYGIVSPRTCGDCGIDKTLYFRLISQPKDAPPYAATEEDTVLVQRILNEPESVTPPVEEPEPESDR